MRSGFGNKTFQRGKIWPLLWRGQKNNIPVGTYWYCYTYTPEMVLVEAKTFLNKIKGKKFEFPVYYDVEEKAILDTGYDNVNSLINTFCGELEKNNYYYGLYSSSNYLNNLISEEVKKNMLYG